MYFPSEPTTLYSSDEQQGFQMRRFTDVCDHCKIKVFALFIQAQCLLVLNLLSLEFTSTVGVAAHIAVDK
ncbi:hypothetical protein V6Z11_A11G337200 [Gossypium hirsutum]